MKKNFISAMLILSLASNTVIGSPASLAIKEAPSELSEKEMKILKRIQTKSMISVVLGLFSLYPYYADSSSLDQSALREKYTGSITPYMKHSPIPKMILSAITGSLSAMTLQSQKRKFLKVISVLSVVDGTATTVDAAAKLYTFKNMQDESNKHALIDSVMTKLNIDPLLFEETRQGLLDPNTTDSQIKDGQSSLQWMKIQHNTEYLGGGLIAGVVGPAQMMDGVLLAKEAWKNEMRASVANP